MPVEIEMAMDVMELETEVALLPAVEHYPLPAIDTESVEQAAELLAGAKRPMIVIGSGALDAAESLFAVANALQAPVVSKRKGRGVIDDRHYLSQNLPAGHRLWGQADAVLAVGTRLKMPLTMWGKDDALKIDAVACDGARGFLSSIKKHAKNALIVLDHFHVKSYLNDALDTVRKEQLKK